MFRNNIFADHHYGSYSNWWLLHISLTVVESYKSRLTFFPVYCPADVVRRSSLSMYLYSKQYACASTNTRATAIVYQNP